MFLLQIWNPLLRGFVRHVESVKGQAEGDELLRLAEQANVLHSARDVLRNSPLLQAKVESGRLAVIKALYRLSGGQVVRLTE